MVRVGAWVEVVVVRSCVGVVVVYDVVVVSIELKTKVMLCWYRRSSLLFLFMSALFQ